MAKEDIQIFQLGESWSGIGIFPISDTVELERIDLLEEKWSGMGISTMSDEKLLEYVNHGVANPHRHDHYCCFFVESGLLNFNIDFQNLDIPGPSILLSCPGQIHQMGFAKEVTGWVIAFDPRFINENARAVIEQSFAKIALLALDATENNWFDDLFKLIYSTVNENKSTNFRQQLIQTLINSLFFKIVSIFQSQEDERIQEYSSRSIEIAKKFQQLVKENFLALKKPADYASKMNITVSYLNDTVKSITGFSSTWFIQQEIFREAQRLLFYTNKSIKEIASQLGYEDYKYFIRLFSKTVGTSPANFRKKA